MYQRHINQFHIVNKSYFFSRPLGNNIKINKMLNIKCEIILPFNIFIKTDIKKLIQHKLNLFLSAIFNYLFHALFIQIRHWLSLSNFFHIQRSERIQDTNSDLHERWIYYRQIKLRAKHLLIFKYDETPLVKGGLQPSAVNCQLILFIIGLYYKISV